MKHPLSNYTPVTRLEHFNPFRKGRILTFVRLARHWMDVWTYVYVKEMFTQVGLVLTQKDMCGSYTYKCTFSGPKHRVTTLTADLITHFSQQHHSLSQLSFYYILPSESLNLGEDSFLAAFGQQSPFSHCFHELLGNDQKYSSDCSFVGHAYVSQQCERDTTSVI